MTTSHAARKDIELTRDGRLKNLADWTPQVAHMLAANDGLSLSREHWNFIEVMRDYYAEFNIPPILKLLKKAVLERFQHADVSDAALYELFPGGILVQGTRIAGIPVPHLDAELDPDTHTLRPVADTRAEPPVTHFVGHFEYRGEVFHVSAHGNLIEHHRWDEGMADFLARKEGIALTTEHWVVIYFMRQFYFDYGITPMVRLLMKHMRESMGPKKCTREYLYSLFPGGPARQGSRIAGLPEPQGCTD